MFYPFMFSYLIIVSMLLLDFESVLTLINKIYFVVLPQSPPRKKCILLDLQALIVSETTLFIFQNNLPCIRTHCTE